LENPITEISEESASVIRLPKPERGARLTLRTTAFAFEGKAVARRPEDGYVVFVEGALSGETVEVEVFKAKGRFAEAKLIQVIEPSTDRQTPACPYYGPCGGCSLQHMQYSAQIREKKTHVIDLFERIGKFENPNVLDVLGDEEGQFHYRNKMEFSFSDERWLMPEEIGSKEVLDRFALGLHVRERFDRVLDTHTCLLPKPAAVEILNFSRDWARRHNQEVYSPDKNPTGLLRFLVVKTSATEPEVMVNLVTSRYDENLMKLFREELLAAVPAVTTIVNNINSRRAQVAQGDSEELLYGSGFIRDRIGKNLFQISANSFFQANTKQTKLLYATACDYAELRKDDILWDLYCGAGTITLFAADRVKSVLGIELAEGAIRDAEANAKRNGVTNVDFVASDLRKALTTPEFLERYPRPTAMIIDPPRSGMHPDVVQEILELAPERIAYISCNPATQARDIAMMQEKYSVEVLQPVDMFPQTFHIECVAKLRRRSY
jgi:23S rRNA (uracil1939-C5)-methyltransferase